MKKTILYILLSLVAGNFLHAQIPLDEKNSVFVENLSEQVNIYTDRDFYLSGEQLWFTAYVVVNNSFKEFDLSKIVYIELFDAEKKKIFKGKFEIVEGIASGELQIPIEILTGNYLIRAYTQYQRNFPPGFFATKMITIINPEFSLPEHESRSFGTDSITGEKENTDPPILVSDKKIEIGVQADKAVYGKREELELKFTIPDLPDDEIAAFCVSVVRKGTVREQEGFFTGHGTEVGKNLSKMFYIPEIRGVSISGSVTEIKSKNPRPDINIYLSVLGNNPQMHITKTKEDGAFIFSLGYLSREQEIFIGVEPNSLKGVGLSVNNDFSNEFTHLEKIPVSIDTTYKTLLEEMLVNYQSQKIFMPFDEKVTDISQSDAGIFGKPDVSIRIADYIDLPNLEMVFYELVPTVMIRTTDGKKSMSVLNPETEWSFPNELLLLDYVPVFDLEALLAIPPAKIENIEAINKTYYLGDNTLRNVVMINTKGRDFARYVFPEGSVFVEYQTITPATIFQAPTYESQSEKDSRIPDFRTLLYWNPQLILQGDTSLSFYTSDNTGEYEIIVRGITKSGKSCMGRGLILIE